jgi:acyl carrier protein
VVLASVLDQAAAALALSARQTLDPRRPLREYGLDSLMALDLATALGRLLGRKLPATLVYEHPTAEALTTYLARELGLDLPKPAELADSQRRAAVAEVQNLSEQELNAIVSATLESL